MGSFPIILVYPCPGQLSGLVQALKDVWVEDLLSIGTVKPFDVGVLGRFTRLDELQMDTMAFSPFGERDPNELRAVVAAQLLWVPALFNSSSSLRRLTGETSMPPYLARQL